MPSAGPWMGAAGGPKEKEGASVCRLLLRQHGGPKPLAQLETKRVGASSLSPVGGFQELPERSRAAGRSELFVRDYLLQGPES